jgi:formamidopyrimidine-DNA glycosylase
MPELPDITIYLDALEARVLGQRLDGVRLSSPFLLRTAAPPLSAAPGRRVVALRRLGKRIAFGLEGDLWLVLHLMIAGRLHWHARGAKAPARRGLADFAFENGTLVLTEAGTKKRASLHVVQGSAGLDEHDRGGIQPLDCDLDAFRAALMRESHTLKRALTDPHLFSGIGNAYSDEILHRARLSPVALTRRLDDAEIARLYEATRATLLDWIDRLRGETGAASRRRSPPSGRAWPYTGATASRARVRHAVQRIRYAENETTYCPRCQTGGKLLADRSLSRY